MKKFVLLLGSLAVLSYVQAAPSFTSEEVDIVGIPCNKDLPCPAGMKCTEFKQCIDAIFADMPPTKCTSHSDCDSDYHCNEFKWCIPGAPTPVEEEVEIVGIPCNKDKPCPAGMKCTEFKQCIDAILADMPPTKCSSHSDCDSDYHCNEFKWCIPGAPTPVEEEVEIVGIPCNKDKPCPPGMKCTEFKQCIDAIFNDMPPTKCTCNDDCDPDYHCNEFKWCIPGKPTPVDPVEFLA